MSSTQTEGGPMEIDGDAAFEPIDNDVPMLYHAEADNDIEDDLHTPFEADSEDEGSQSGHSNTSETPMFLAFPNEDQLENLHNLDTDLDEDDPDSISEEPASFALPNNFSDSFAIPEQVKALREKLLGDYTLPEQPPSSPPETETLDSSQELTLKHYAAWYRSNGTVNAYTQHAKVLQDATGETILSLHLARKLAVRITELSPVKVDICPNSCIAYTGEFEGLTSCPHVRDKMVCGEQRYKHVPEDSKQSASRPRAQMMTLPVMASIRAMYSNETSSEQMRHRDKLLQQTLHLVATAAGEARRTYSDFGNSDVHVFHHTKMDLFSDPRDVAMAISTDGAQLTMKKLSDTWLVIIILLNLPATIRYLTGSVIYAFATPGPNPPGNIESFAYPLFAEMARASEGIWTWDAVDSSYFVLRAWVVMILGDMLGSAKLSGMAGHLASHGDRFSMVKAARSSLAKQSKYLYYPMDASEPSNKYNPGRPTYNLGEIPYRREDEYWNTITALSQAQTKARRALIVTQTGVSRMPLCVAGNAFLHPSYFPLDPFHLIYENCMTFIWDIWTQLSTPDEEFHMNSEQAANFGRMVVDAMPTLPPSFCGPIRDPHLKRNSQYKIYEWMALLHWYTIPFAIELGFNEAVLTNFANFVEGVEAAMTIASRTTEEITKIFELFANFLDGFEAIYIGGDPKKTSRCRLCLFQLIHVAQHIHWNGSIRVGSQATCERAIGEVGHKIRSKKAPFAHLANIIHEREMMKILALRVPALREENNVKTQLKRLFTRSKILKREKAPGTKFMKHFDALQSFLRASASASETDIDSWERWGKLNLAGKAKLSSQLSELKGDPPARSSRYFEAFINGSLQFGEALAFYTRALPNGSQEDFVVYHPIVGLHTVHRRWQGKWSATIKVACVPSILTVIGIWAMPQSQNIHILRKHPGLDLLSEAECGLASDEVD